MTAIDLEMAGMEGNIVGRVEELERLVNILTSRGVSARSASDFVQTLGNVNGGNLDLSQSGSSLSAFTTSVTMDQIKAFLVLHGSHVGQILCAAIDPTDGNLVIGGYFTTINGISCNGIAKWNGTTFLPYGSGVSAVTCLGFDPVNSNRLVIGGGFVTANGVTVNGIAYWTGATFAAYGTGVAGSDGFVWGLGFDPANSNRLVITGRFTTANGVTVNGIAYWTGSTFGAYGSGITLGFPYAVGFDTANGNRLIIAGSFTTANGVTVNNLAYWNGTTFVAYGSGTNNTVQCLAFDPGNNNQLVIGGAFTTANGVTVNGLAYWNGSTFVAYGSGLSGTSPLANSLAFDPNDNLKLVVGGQFTGANGVPANNIAKWDNLSTFTAYGSGIGTTVTAVIYSLVYDSTGALYISGAFTAFNGVAARNLVKYWTTSTLYNILTQLLNGECQLPHNLGVMADEMVWSGGLTRISDISNQQFGFVINHAVSANGSTITWGGMLDAGTYTIFLLGEKKSNCGMTDIYVDGVLIQSGFDWYAGSATYNVIQTVSPTVTLAAGYHVFQLIVNGHNGSSSNYVVDLTRAWVTPANY